MEESLGKLVERLLQGSGHSALRLSLGEILVTIGPSGEGGFCLEVERPGGRVGEREAVDIAIQIHRLIERAGAPVEAEMLAFRGSGRSRCFVFGMRERISA